MNLSPWKKCFTATPLRRKFTKLRSVDNALARQSTSQLGFASTVFTPPSVPPLSGDRNANLHCLLALFA